MFSPRIRLGAMMFMQYAIWGVWAPILGLHLANLDAFRNATGVIQWKIGIIYMTLPIATIISPFIGGQIADRWFASQRFLSVSHFLGGIILLVVTQLTGFGEIFVGMLIYNLVYAPTIALTNSIVFHHWPNEQFSRIRVWGSIGWIVIGWIFGAWLPSTIECTKCGEIMNIAGLGDWFFSLLKIDHTLAFRDCLYFAAILSFVLSILSLALPHTPPSKQSGRPWAFVDAFALMRNPAFAVMAIVAFFVAAEMQCYFIWGQSFLKGLIQADRWVAPVMTLGQTCEMVMMILLPLVLRRAGFRITMALGIAAWALRDLIFSFGQPTPLVIAAVSLHGVGFAFFFTTIFMFADAAAPKDIKASAQSFLSSMTIGLGMLAGSLSAGINDYFQGDWHKTFLTPSILLMVCCLVFLAIFRPKTTQEPTAD